MGVQCFCYLFLENVIRNNVLAGFSLTPGQFKVSTDKSAFLVLLEKVKIPYQVFFTCASAPHRLQGFMDASGAALLWAWAAELGELKPDFYTE